MKARPFIAIMFFLAGPVCLSHCSPSSDASNEITKSWTLILYMDGDNTLEPDFIESFLQMAQVGSDNNINVLVQFDRSPKYDQRYGDWTIANRFYVTQQMTPTQENAVPDWGDGQGGREVDMANPRTLTDFIVWAVSNYPARRYAVVIGDHGTAWMGVCLDETSGDYWMYLSEVRKALQDALVPMDLIGFDACLMATVDAAWQVKDLGAEVMVGSEASAHGWPWDLILERLVLNPGWGPADLGTWINDSYYERYVTEKAENRMTHSTLDLRRIEGLAELVSDFSDKAVSGADFEEVRAAAVNIRDMVNNTVLYSRAGPDLIHAKGLTTYFALDRPGPIPEIPDNWQFYTGKLTPFADAGKWRQFLSAVLSFDPHIDYRIQDARRALTEDYEDGTIVDMYYFFGTLANM